MRGAGSVGNQPRSPEDVITTSGVAHIKKPEFRPPGLGNLRCYRICRITCRHNSVHEPKIRARISALGSVEMLVDANETSEATSAASVSSSASQLSRCGPLES